MLAALSILCLSLASCGGPRNYNQCILENVKPGLSNDAIRAVKQACEGEFSPERPAESEDAPLTEPADDMMIMEDSSATMDSSEAATYE